MTVENKAILHINAALESVAPAQMAVEAIVNPETGYRMWGGKDAQGVVSRWLAAGRPGVLSTLKLTGPTTSGAGVGILKHDTYGNIIGGELTPEYLPDHNNLDAIQGGISDERYHLTADQVSVVDAAILQDGSRSFTGTVSGVDPTDPTHLATKSYVDSMAADWDFLDPCIDFWDASAGLPVGPTTGARYVCSAAGNGWALNSVYEWTGSIWAATVPTTGQAVVVGSGSTTGLYIFTGTTWKAVGSTVTAPQYEILFGTGSGYTSSSEITAPPGGLRLYGRRLVLEGDAYPGGCPDTSPVGSSREVARTVSARWGTGHPPESGIQRYAGWSINDSATTWESMHHYTDSGFAMTAATFTRQALILGATFDGAGGHISKLAASTIAQIVLVYDGDVGALFRGSYDMGPTDRTGYMGVFDRNVGPGWPVDPVFDWTFEVEETTGYAPVSFSETYPSQIITGGLNISGGRAPGVAAGTFRRDTYLYPEYLVNGRQPAHVKHGIDATNDRTLAWNYTWTFATSTVSVPAGARAWFWGTAYDVGGQSVVLNGGTPPTGRWYVSFTRNETTGAVTLQASTTPWTLFTHVPLCTIYVNNALPGAFDTDERHNCFRSLDWHNFSHWALGTRVRLDGGFSAGDYVPNTDTLTARQPITAAGVVMDEDIIHTVPETTKGVYSTFWLQGAAGRLAWFDGRTVPAEVGASYVQYNQYTGGAWTLTEVPQGYYVCYYEAVTMRGDTSKAGIFIPGQAAYATEAEAVAETWSGRVAGDFPTLEAVLLRKWVYKTSNAYSAPGKYRIVKVIDLVNTNAGSGSSAIPPHNGLTGRDSAGAHPIAAIYAPAGSEGMAAYYSATDVLQATAAITYNTTSGLINTQRFALDYTPTGSEPEGTIYWDNHNHLPAARTANAAVTLNVGAETYWGGGLVKNISGVTIPNGAVVICTGSSGGLATVALAQANTAAGSRIVGVATCSISDGAFGYVTGYGIVRDLATNTYSVGDVIYLSAATAGAFTATAPAHPNYAIKVGRVVSSHNTQGEIMVNIGPAWADVATFNEIRSSRSVAAGDGVRFTNANGYYMGVKASTSQAANYELTLPVDDGTTGQFMRTNGAGVLSWADIVLSDITGGTAYHLAGFGADTALTPLPNFYFSSDGAKLGIGRTPSTYNLDTYTATGAAQIAAETADPSTFAGFRAINGLVNTRLLAFGAEETGTLFGLARASSAGLYVSEGNLFLGTYTDLFDVIFGSANTYRGRITSTGEWRIGGDSVNAGRLDVYGTSTNPYAIMLRDPRSNLTLRGPRLGYYGKSTAGVETLLGYTRIRRNNDSTNDSSTYDVYVNDAAGGLVNAYQAASTGLILPLQHSVDFGDADSSNFAKIKAPATLSADYTLTLPTTDGAANQVLTTDGSGVLSWTNKPVLTKTIIIEAPTSTENITIFKTDAAITVQEVVAVLVGSSTPTVSYLVKQDGTRSNAGTTVATGTSVTNTTTGAAATINSAAIGADKWVWLTTSAASGTITSIAVDIRYTED